MPALLTPPPDRLVTVGRALDRSWPNERPAGAPPPTSSVGSRAEHSGHGATVQAGPLEREARWACEWWPPD